MAPTLSYCHRQGHRRHGVVVRLFAAAAALSLASAQYDTIDGHDCFRSLRGITDSMFDLADQYPDLASVSIIGESYLKSVDDNNDEYELSQNGYDIYAMNITASDGPHTSNDKGKALIISGVHPREFAPVELVMRFAESLLEGYDADSDVTWLLQHTEVHLIFHVNPDGRYVTENYQDTSWRKNLNPRTSGDCDEDEVGVDLNRNFDFQWGNSDGSSSNPCSNTYHGRSPESEPETRAVVEYAKTLFPEGQRKDDPVGDMDEPFGEDNVGVFVDVHAPGGYIFYPWGFEDSKSPDNGSLEAMGRKVSSFNGYLLWAGGQPDFQYAAAGDSSDYMYAVLGAASLGLELGEDFYESCDLFERDIVPDNLPALRYVVSTAKRPFSLAKGPDILELEVVVSDVPGEGLSVSAVASDSLMVNSLSDEDYPDFETGDQGVSKVQVYLDVHPDDYNVFDDTTWEMESVDVVSERHTFELEVPSTMGLSSGRHILYAQAMDAEGYSGPVSSAFFDVERVETLTPSKSPTSSPSLTPTDQPTARPSNAPSLSPVTAEPTPLPTSEPSEAPTSTPSTSPTANPTIAPSPEPTTSAPSRSPSLGPTIEPTASPTIAPTTAEPTRSPTKAPTTQPSTAAPEPNRSRTMTPTPNPQLEPVGPTLVDLTQPTSNSLDQVPAAVDLPSDSAAGNTVLSIGATAAVVSLSLLLF